MYFKNVDCIEELKRQYHRLAMKYHPDLGGDTATMQAINAEYDKLFQRYKNIHKNRNGEAYERQEEIKETPEQFRHIIDAIIHLDGITVEICGAWIWVTGNTYEHRETLKGLAFRFSKRKQAWYWHEDGYRKHSNKYFTLDEIRALHGSDVLKSDVQKKLKEAV